MTTRRAFLQSSLAAVALSAATRRPNIVLILADDLGYECLGCNGASEYKTPNLDRLAAAGVRFTNAHSTPLCTPTRVQLMTGKYNFRNYTEFGSLAPNQSTFGHLLQKAGYRTGVAGKWQLAGAIEGTNYKGEGTSPQDAGFDEHCLWQVKSRGSRYWDPIIQVNGKLEAVRKDEYGPNIFEAFADGFFQRHRSRPFFFYYPMVLTHDPFVPTPASASPSAAKRNEPDKAWFGDMVAYMDRVVGNVLASLDRHGLAESTLVIFTGDNGTHPSIVTDTRKGPVRGDKGNTTFAGTHVPFIARGAGSSARGTVCDDLVDFTDFFPTFAEASGGKIPDDHPRDGRTFLPQIRGKKGNPRDHIFCHYAPRWGKFKPARWAMDKTFKLYDDGRFFNYRQDAEEKNPLPAEGPAAAALRKVIDRMS
jgi:arylsulfatase A-like enzyme